MDFLNNVTWLKSQQLLGCPFEKRSEVKFQMGSSVNKFFYARKLFIV